MDAPRLDHLADGVEDPPRPRRGPQPRPPVHQHRGVEALVVQRRGGDVKGLQLGGLTHEEKLALARPAVISVREQLRHRLGRQVGRAWWRWLRPPAAPARRPVPVAADTRRLRQCPRQTALSGYGPWSRQHRRHPPPRQPSGRPRRTRAPAAGCGRTVDRRSCPPPSPADGGVRHHQAAPGGRSGSDPPCAARVPTCSPATAAPAPSPHRCRTQAIDQHTIA
jgi:hypothetical protein